MTTFGMPTSMFLVFLATILAGSLGALHYLVVHIILRRPFGDEGTRGPGRATDAPPPGGAAPPPGPGGAAPGGAGRPWGSGGGHHG